MSTAAIIRTCEKTNIWLKELEEELDWDDRDMVFRALRVVLHQLRDRMPVKEATDLGAQLPTLIRGVYYESWNPLHNPQPIHKAEDFVNDLIKKLHGHEEIHAESAMRGVFTLLSTHITKGEIDDVIGTLPDEIKAYWPARRAA